MQTQQRADEKQRIAQSNAIDGGRGLISGAQSKPPSLNFLASVVGENAECALQLESNIQSLLDNLRAEGDDPRPAGTMPGGNGALREISTKNEVISSSINRSAQMISAIHDILFS